MCIRTRRGFILTLGAAAMAASAGIAHARGDDRILWLIRDDRSIVAPLIHDGRYDRAGYYRLCEAFRDSSVPPTVGYVQMDPRLLDALWEIQRYYRQIGIDAPIDIISGFRTPAHNEAVGGAAGSWHLAARAADFVVRGVASSHTAAVARAMPAWLIGGVGEYPGHVHGDTGPRKDAGGNDRFWTGVDH